MVKGCLLILFDFYSRSACSTSYESLTLSGLSFCQHTLAKKVERIGRISFHWVAASSVFGIEEENPFRDCIDSLLVDLKG